MAKIIIGVVVALVVMVLGNILLPVEQAFISVAAEPVFGSLTNAVLTSILLSIVIIILALVVKSGLKEQPGGLQNIVEIAIEAMDKLVNNIAPKKWVPSFFPILATIFIYLLFANWFGLLTPALVSFGWVHTVPAGEGMDPNSVTVISGVPSDLPHHGGEDATHGEEEGAHDEAADSHGEAVGAEHEGDMEHETGKDVVIVPWFRAPSSDLNLALTLALISVVLTQIYGFRARGIGYLGNFFRFKSFSTKGVGMGFIDFFVGILELVSEFAKILSFSFRLFGNIFAGEVILIVISALVSLLLVNVFLGLEIFVGFIQAFVFFILTLVFFSMATKHHGEGH